MAGVNGEVAAELSRVDGELPGWRPWVSDAGRWWAPLREAIAGQERLANLVGAT